jgi:glycosyltransferase involved in cell wall biosynthesis
MERRISIVIPNYNNADTIGKCLESSFASRYSNYEVIVVDDCSTDNSPDIIRGYPCTLIRLEEHAATSRARNIGGMSSTGDVIFFTDADCLLRQDTLSKINAALSTAEPGTVIGGTYSRLPYDTGFPSIFQSVFVHYFETKKEIDPDYIAAHAMIIDARSFRESGGFPEKFLPIIEDVEFSHRLRRQGFRFRMNPEIQVHHIFNFSFFRSMKNAVRKTRYWTIYSLKNRTTLTDSGTASTELKISVLSCFISTLIVLLWAITQQPLFLLLLCIVFSVNIFVSRGLLKAFFETKGMFFLLTATLYYTTCFSFAVGFGTIRGVAHYFSGIKDHY